MHGGDALEASVLLELFESIQKRFTCHRIENSIIFAQRVRKFAVIHGDELCSTGENIIQCLFVFLVTHLSVDVEENAFSNEGIGKAVEKHFDDFKVAVAGGLSEGTLTYSFKKAITNRVRSLIALDGKSPCTTR